MTRRQPELMDPDMNTVSTPMENNGEGNSKIHYHSKSSTNIESLPIELVFEILLHLPAEDIYNGARLVCKKWHNMVETRNFKYKHLHNSTVGLIIQSSGSGLPDFVTMRKGRVEISMWKCYNFPEVIFSCSNGFTSKWKCYNIPEVICSSCNGLTLHFDSKKGDALYILNRATNRRFDLPPFFSKWENHHYFSAIAYVAASMEYKVVHTYYSDDRNPVVRDCAILTVGVDNSWRHIDSENLSLEAGERLIGIPVTTEGFVHWTYGDDTQTRILSLDVETEIITEIPVPRGDPRLKSYLPMGSSLTLLIACGEFSWDVWEMKPKTREWTKLPKIDLEPHKGKFGNLVRACCFNHRPPCSVVLKPGGWLNEEVLVFHASPSRVCVVYDVRTQEIDLFDLNCCCDRFWFTGHRNSLVSVGGC